MKKNIKIKIGLCGITFGSVNYGVTALAISQIVLIYQCIQKLNLDYEIYIFSMDKQINVESLCRKLGIDNVKVCQPARLRTGIKGFWELKKNIAHCDFVFDLTKGDSFSDIYGYNRFVLQAIEKRLSIKYSKLIVSPQTIGPFKNYFVNKEAKYLLKNSSHVFARDLKSSECVKKLCPDVEVKTTSDLAFYLPYEKASKESETDRKIHVGVNVSGLLWNGGYTGKNEFGLKCDYKKFTTKLVESLDQNGNYIITFFAHVYMDGGDDDYRVCEELHSLYPYTNLAKKFHDPIEVKSFMTKLDVVIGARMHATIGAISSGTVTIPFSYSRKFEGLYDLLEYPYVIEGTNWKTKQALDFTLNCFNKLDELNLCAKQAVIYALEKNEKYQNTVLTLIQEWREENAK